MGVSSTQSATALTDSFIIQSRIDIHGCGKVRMPQHTLQNLWRHCSAVGRDRGVTVAELMCRKWSYTDLLQLFHHGIPAVAQGTLSNWLAILMHDKSRFLRFAKVR